MKTSTINARIRARVKGKVEEVLSKFGISTTQAITMLFELIKINSDTPFSFQLPNDEAMQYARNNNLEPLDFPQK